MQIPKDRKRCDEFSRTCKIDNKKMSEYTLVIILVVAWEKSPIAKKGIDWPTEILKEVVQRD